MELLNIITARAVWLFDIAELNPRGKAIYPNLFEWLKDAYHFEKIPSSVTDVDDTKAFVFSTGHYQAREEIFVSIDLKIYNDGLVANTQSSTRDTDKFLEDVLISASAEFNLNYKPAMIRRKLYLSELNALSPRNIVSPGLEKFASRIAEALPEQGRVGFEFAGVSFWPRQSFPPMTISAFHIERKINTDRDQNKYFSRAPLHTDEHLRLLAEFEADLMA